MEIYSTGEEVLQGEQVLHTLLILIGNPPWSPGILESMDYPGTRKDTPPGSPPSMLGVQILVIGQLEFKVWVSLIPIFSKDVGTLPVF